MAKRGRRPGQNNDLSEMELDIMGIVWRLGECNSPQIIQEYCAKRPLAETTIRTVLSNLRKKGYLELVPTTAAAYVYRGAVSRESVARRNLRKLVGRLFGGSPKEAIAYLIEDEDLDDAEIKAIQDLIAAKWGGGNHGN